MVAIHFQTTVTDGNLSYFTELLVVPDSSEIIYKITGMQF